jgi:hypothetical protein
MFMYFDEFTDEGYSIPIMTEQPRSWYPIWKGVLDQDVYSSLYLELQLNEHGNARYVEIAMQSLPQETVEINWLKQGYVSPNHGEVISAQKLTETIVTEEVINPWLGWLMMQGLRLAGKEVDLHCT